MVIQQHKKWKVILCGCDQAFQGDNHKKHKRNAIEQKKEAEGLHTNVKRVLYCGTCNVWGKEGESFPHQNCTYVRFNKADLKEIVNGRQPLEREKAIQEAKKREAKGMAPVTGEEGKTAAVPMSEREETEAAVAAITEGNKKEAFRNELESVFGSSVSSSYSELVIDDGEEDGEKRKEKAITEEEAEVLSEESESEEEVQKKREKRPGVDIDSASSDDDDYIHITRKRKRTSSPQSRSSPPPLSCEVSPVELPTQPRYNCVAVSQTHAKNNLMSLNNRLKKQLHESQQETALLRSKFETQQRFEKEVIELRQAKKELQEQKNNIMERNKGLLEKLKMLEEQLEKERKERAIEKGEADSRISNWKKAAEVTQAKLDDHHKQLERENKAKADEEKKVTFHLECINGRIESHSIEDESLDSTVVCYSSEAIGAHCHHVILKGRDMKVKVRNTKWPTHRKCKLEYFCCEVDYTLYYFSLQKRCRSRGGGDKEEQHSHTFNSLISCERPNGPQGATL